MKIVVPELFFTSALERLTPSGELVYDPSLHARRAELLAALADAQALIVRNQTVVDAALLKLAARLCIVGRAGAGLDNIDLSAAEAQGVVVVTAPEENAVSVAEHTLALLLALARNIPSHDRAVKAGRWERESPGAFELYGKTLGLIGLGRIGFRVAQRARAFGMRILAHDPFLSPHNLPVSESGAELVGLGELLARSDVVSLHVPLNSRTRGLLNAERLFAMKRGAVLINTARGALVDEAALLRALQCQHLRGAALDVRASEPPGHDALARLPNVILTPHVGAMTPEAQTRVVSAVVDDVLRVLRGQPARQAVGRKYPAAERDPFGPLSAAPPPTLWRQGASAPRGE